MNLYLCMANYPVTTSRVLMGSTCNIADGVDVQRHFSATAVSTLSTVVKEIKENGLHTHVVEQQ